MTDTILTIVGTSVYIPFLVYLAHSRWDKATWSRQLLLVLLTLQATTLLHIPSVMYCSAVMLLVALITHLMVARPTFRVTPVFICAALYIAWFAVSLSWSAAPRKGLRFLLDSGLPLLGFATIGSILNVTREEYIRSMRTWVYAALIFVIVGAGTWLTGCVQLHLWPWEWPLTGKSFDDGCSIYCWVFRFLGGIKGYSHPSYNLLPLFAVLSLAMGLRKRGELSAWLWWCIWGGGLLLSIVSQSRMSILYSILLFVCYAIYMQRTARRQVIATVCIVIIGITSLVTTLPFWERFGADSIRDELTDKTLQYIHAKPWTGAGAGALNPVEICHTIGADFWPHVGFIAPDADATEWTPKSHMLPHNEWLADAAHAGIIAALLSLVMYMAAGVECVRKKRWEVGVWLVIFCIFSLLEPPLYIGKGLYLFCLISCGLSLPALSTTDREECRD